MKKFQATLDGQEVLVLEVSLEQEKALIAVDKKLKVIPLRNLDLTVKQFLQLKLGVRDDVN